MEKDNQIFGIRAIIEAINAKKEIDKVFVQKDAQGDLMQDLMKTMKIPLEKRLKIMMKINYTSM